MNRFIEVSILAIVCFLVFFVNLDKHQYIKTEALRAVVVEEMLDRDGLTMPTIHTVPYLKKPPLYAWTTTELARVLGTFDEQIARLPSAFSGTMFVFLMYLLGETWVGRRAGFAAAVFTLLNPTIIDYGVRAELDLPFSLLCTAGIGLTLGALRASGGKSCVFWFIAYLLALAAAMWKGPHSLIFMWLTMLGYGKLTGNWRFLKNPVQWICLASVLGILTWWATALSDFAGPSIVGRTAGIELFVRLAPHKGEHFLSILTFLPMLVIITLPASAFALLSFRPDVRTTCGLAVACDSDNNKPVGGTKTAKLKAHLSDWWMAIKSNPLGLVLLSWLIPNLIFMAIAPAKSPRYTIPIFAPMILLGTWMLTLVENAGKSSPIHIHSQRIWRVFFRFLAAVGGAGAVRLFVGLAGIDTKIGELDCYWPWILLAVGGIIPFVIDATKPGGRSLNTRLILILVFLIMLQPALHKVWWPVRVESASQQLFCDKVAELVPEGETIYVVGVHEYPDNQIYSHRHIVTVNSLEEALEKSGTGKAYAIVRVKELAKEFSVNTTAKYRELFKFRRTDKDNLFIEITPGDKSTQ